MWTRGRIVLTTVYCLAFVAFVCPKRFLTVALHDYDFTSWHVALITSVHPVASFVASPVWGYWADHWHSLNGFKVILSAICVASMAVFATLFQSHVHATTPRMLAWASVYGLVAASPIITLMTKHAAPGANKSVWAPVRGAAAGAYGLGAVLVGFLLDHLATVSVAWLYAATLGTSLLVALFFLEEQPRYFDSDEERQQEAEDLEEPAATTPPDDRLRKKLLHDYATTGSAINSDDASGTPPDSRALRSDEADRLIATTVPVTQRYAALTIPFLTRHNASFHMMLLVFGALMGVVQNLLFFYLRDLDADTTVLGISVFATVCSEVYLIPRARDMYDRLGVRWLFHIAGVAFIVRMALYPIFDLDSSISTAWILPIELLHGVTFSCFLAGVQMHQKPIIVSHMRRLGIPVGSMALDGAAQGWYGALYRGLGRAAGTITAGWIYAEYGPTKLFFGCAVFMTISLIIFDLVWVEEPAVIVPKPRRNTWYTEEERQFETTSSMMD